MKTAWILPFEWKTWNIHKLRLTLRLVLHSAPFGAKELGDLRQESTTMQTRPPKRLSQLVWMSHSPFWYQCMLCSHTRSVWYPLDLPRQRGTEEVVTSYCCSASLLAVRILRKTFDAVRTVKIILFHKTFKPETPNFCNSGVPTDALLTTALLRMP